MSKAAAHSTQTMAMLWEIEILCNTTKHPLIYIYTRKQIFWTYLLTCSTAKKGNVEWIRFWCLFIFELTSICQFFLSSQTLKTRTSGKNTCIVWIIHTFTLSCYASTPIAFLRFAKHIVWRMTREYEQIETYGNRVRGVNVGACYGLR